MYKCSRRSFFVCALLVSVTSVAVAEPKSAEKKVPPLQRVGEEAYQAIVDWYDYDNTIPLEARTVQQREVDGWVQEKIVLRTTQGFLAPGYLQIPNVGEAPYPCVLLLHGWSGSKESWYGDNNYISGGNIRKGLLKRGYAVFMLDAQCHGDRISQNDFAPVNHYLDPDQSNKGQRKGYFTQREIYVQTVVDYRRALDYLETREEIDPERIGLIGYSMGGAQSYPLTAVESRIKVTVACATPSDVDKFSLIAPQNYVRGIGDRPFFMVQGNNDPMCTVGRAEELHAMFQTEHTDLKFYGGHHKLTHDFVPDALAWIEKHLGKK